MSDPASDYRNWISKAEEDWLAIRNNITAAETPWAVVCFHAQQAAEKYLKAFLVHRGYQPEKIHALDRLLVECLAFDQNLNGLKEDCMQLTDHAVDSRYPDTLVKDEERIAREAVAMAERICDAIRQRLSKP